MKNIKTSKPCIIQDKKIKNQIFYYQLNNGKHLKINFEYKNLPEMLVKKLRFIN